MSTSLKLIAVGDISFGDFPLYPGFGIRSSLSHGLSPFRNILPIISEGDIVFGNLETILSNYNLNPNDLRSWEMRGSPESVRLLTEAGFNVLNVANNHTMQHGIEPFTETVTNLQDEGILVTGLVGKHLNSSNPVILNVNGRSIGFLGYAFEEDIYGNQKIGYAFGPSCNLREDVEALRNKVDILIVSCHWGLEFMSRPSPNTIMLGRNLVEWGADIVLGHHPHVLHGYERYKDGIILYSMGNFLFDMIWDAKFRQSAIFVFDINDTINIRTFPVYISDDYSPKLMSGDSANIHRQRLKLLSEKIESTMNGNLEKNALNYYLEYERLKRRNRYRCYLYFLRNSFRVDKCLLSQVILRTLTRFYREIMMHLRIFSDF